MLATCGGAALGGYQVSHGMPTVGFRDLCNSLYISRDGVMHPLPIDYERLLQEAYEAFLSPGDIVVDVGAHLGRHTVPLSRCVSPGGQVFAVEPLPACRERLQQTL